MASEIRWIEDGLQNPGKSRKGIARTLGIHEASITRLLQGKRRLQAREIEPIARYLGVIPPPVAGHFQPTPADAVPERRDPPKSIPSGIPVTGLIELGAFREPSSDRSDARPASPDLRHSDCRQLAFEVRGGDGEDLGISAGMIAVVADYAAFQLRHGLPPDGRAVVVEARLSAGEQILQERSFRRLRYGESAVLLDPLSPDRGRTLVIPRAGSQEGHDVVVVGVLLQAIRRF